MNTVWKSQETKINLFCKFQEQKSPATFHHASVFKCCLHRFVFNLGQLSTVRGFLGFAFQCFLLKCFFIFLEASLLFVGKQRFYFHPLPDLEKLYIWFSLVSLTHSLFENVKFFILFFKLLEFKSSHSHWTPVFQGIVPKLFTHTQNNKSIVLLIQNVSKRLLFITRGFALLPGFFFYKGNWLWERSRQF